MIPLRVAVGLMLVSLINICLAGQSNHHWETVVSKNAGLYVFEYSSEKEEIVVRRARNGASMTPIKGEMNEDGWLDFVDLNGDGHKDVVVYPSGYGSSPLPSGFAYIFQPSTGDFEMADIGSGLIKKSKPSGCIHITRRLSASQRPNYETSRFCYDRRSNVWVHRADYYDLPERAKGTPHW
jgi:hypothetical protein